MSDKIKALEALRWSGGVLCHGTFDGFHIGHLHYLQAAYQLGRPLTVTLTGDRYVRHHGDGRPVFPEDLRAEMLAALEVVTVVAIVQDESAIPAIMAIRPEIYCKGDETRREGNEQLEAEIAAVKACGGRIVFIPKLLPYSSGAMLSGELLRRRLAEPRPRGIGEGDIGVE